MFLRKYWEVLVVDDEPDIHAVTKLALDEMKIYDVPLHVHAAPTAAEGRKVVDAMRVGKDGISELAIALIDVVMETDTAGLELCRYIREELQNRITGIVVRTGQAGKAPERAVIDRYDISTYITKVEATEDRLYTLVKGGIRQYLSTRVPHMVRLATTATVEAFVQSDRRREAIFEVLPKLLSSQKYNIDGQAMPGVDVHSAFIIGDRVAGTGDYADPDVAIRLRDELRDRQPTMIGFQGEQGRQYGADVLLSLPIQARTQTQTQVDIVARVSLAMPDFIPLSFFGWMYAVRSLFAIAVP
jgi:CheY-like chemotaxis protein